MADEIAGELGELIKKGRELLDELASEDEDGWIDYGAVEPYEDWLYGVGHLLLTAEGPESGHFADFRRILNTQRNPVGVKTSVFRDTFDLVLSVFEEWSCGTLKKFEDIVAATILDSLLDQADGYRKSNRTVESSVLAGAVLEHAVGRISAKNGLRMEVESLSKAAAALADSAVLGQDGDRRLAVLLELRKSGQALEGEDLDGLIDNTRKLVEEFV
jgi:hypothetical protein